MRDIVERLEAIDATHATAKEAATEIRTLRTELAAEREAVRVLAEWIVNAWACDNWVAEENGQRTVEIYEMNNAIADAAITRAKEGSNEPPRNDA